MMRSLTLLLALVVLPAAQEVEIVPRFVAGAEFRLEVTRSTENSERPKSNYSISRTVDVRVVSVNRDGAVLEWKPRPSILERLAALADPSTAMAFQIVGQVPFTLLLDGDGALEGFGDEAALGQRLVVARDAMLKKTFDGLKPEEIKKADDLMQRVLSPANLIDLATRDAQVYAAVHGVALAAGESVEVDIEQPNPFGGKPMPAKVRIQMASVAPAAATVAMSITYAPEGFRDVMMSLMGDIAPAKIQEEMQKTKLALTEEGTYVFDRKLRLVRDVTYTRKTNIDAHSKIEKWVIRLVNEPKR